LTKHIHEDALRSHLEIEDVKVDVVPKLIDDSLIIGSPQITRKPKGKTKVRMAKSKAPAKRTSRLERAICNLYNLEEVHESETPLNIDFGLYQMEDY
jgi:hypothetical protein